MKFPLPLGHFFGYNPFDVRCHTCEDNWVDEARLKSWQRAYAMRIDRRLPVTGRFDGPTQRAVVSLQRSKGLAVTAVLDEDTWTAAFETLGATQTVEHDQPPTEVPPTHADAPEGVSGGSGTPAAEGDSGATGSDLGSGQLAEETLPQPPGWYNSLSPVGPGHRGPLVRKIRILLGMQPRDTWSHEVSQRVRGLQKAHGLPVTGWVDTRTAVLLDSLPAKR